MMGVKLFNTISGGGGELELISEETFAASVVSWAGLSGDFAYLIYVQLNTTAGGTYRMELNGDANQTHYYTQGIIGSAAVLSGQRSNDCSLGNCLAGGGSFIVEVFKDFSDHLNFYSRNCCGATNALQAQYWLGAKTDATAAEVTGISILQVGGNDTTGTATLYRINR